MSEWREKRRLSEPEDWPECWDWWVRRTEAEKRIEELEAAHAEADKLFHQIADQRDELHRKYGALVGGLISLDRFGFPPITDEVVRYSDIRALLGDDDD